MRIVSMCSNAGGSWNRDAIANCWTKRACTMLCGGNKLASVRSRGSASPILKLRRFLSPHPNREVLNPVYVTSIRHLGYCTPPLSDIVFGIYPVIDTPLHRWNSLQGGTGCARTH